MTPLVFDFQKSIYKIKQKSPYRFFYERFFFYDFRFCANHMGQSCESQIRNTCALMGFLEGQNEKNHWKLLSIF